MRIPVPPTRMFSFRTHSVIVAPTGSRDRRNRLDPKKIYFSCQNVTTCRLYIALKWRVARSFVRSFNSFPVVTSLKSWPSPGGSLLNPPARLGIFLLSFFFFLVSPVSDLYPKPVLFFRSPPYRVPRKEETQELITHSLRYTIPSPVTSA